MSKSEYIIYIDPVSSVQMEYKNGISNRVKEISKDCFLCSRVKHKNILTHTFKTRSDILDEELETDIEIEMYENAGLDINKQYKIDYIKKKLDYEESYLVECFAVKEEQIIEQMKPILKYSKHIDFIANPFLVFSTFYDNKIISGKNDIFVYLGKNEAFLSVYKDGGYISSASLKTLSDMLSSLQEDGHDLEISDLENILKEKGLEQSSYKEEEVPVYSFINHFFLEMFSKINNIAMHNRSIFGFDTIERIFFSTDLGKTKGLKLFLTQLDMNSVELKDFNLFKQKKEDFFYENIVASYCFDKFKNQDNTHNLTIFQKLPSWYKTEAGKFVLFFIFLLSIFSSILIYYYINIDILTNRYNKLDHQYKIIKTANRKLQLKIDSVKKQIYLNNMIIKKDINKLQNISKTVDKLIYMKSKNEKSITMLLIINHYLKKYKLRLQSIEQTGNNKVVLMIVANYNKRDLIAKFMKDLIGYGFIKVDSNEIKLNQKTYISKIEIVK